MDEARFLTSIELETLRMATRKEWHAHAKSVRALLRNSPRALHEAQRKWRRDQAEAQARFSFQHSDQLTTLAFADARAMLGLAIERLPPREFEWLPQGLPPREAILEGRWWNALQKKLQGGLKSFYLGPVIFWYGTLPIEVGSQFTVSGARLGMTAGTATLVDCRGNRHTLTIVAWSETAVQIAVPAGLTGIPFDCGGQVEILLADGTLFSNPVTVEPASDLLFSVDSFSAHDSAVFHTFSKSHTFKSAALPGSFRQFNISAPISELHVGCVVFKTFNDLFTRIDGPVHVSVTGGPSVAEGVLEVKTLLTDDHRWDFTVDAEFFIVVPLGIAAPGWQT